MAAEKNHPAAQCNYGVCLESGRGVAKDEVAAAEWYRKASDQNDPFASYNLGHMLAGGAHSMLHHAVPRLPLFSKKVTLTFIAL